MTAASPNAYDHLVVAAGRRVRVRHKVRDDARDDFRWRTDPENVRFDGASTLRETFDEFLRQLENDIAFGPPDKELFAIVDEAGEHIGNLMYYNADTYRGEAEIGISLGDEGSRGHGLGSEALIVFLRYLWSHHAFTRIYLHTLEWNERAIGCFRKAGFDAVAHVVRDENSFLRMEVRREWWLLWDAEGRFGALA